MSCAPLLCGSYQIAETVIPAPGSDRSSPCVTLDFSAPLGGVVFDGFTQYWQRRYFATGTVFVSWSGFVDPNNGVIVGYRIALSTSSNATQCAGLAVTVNGSAAIGDVVYLPQEQYVLCTWLTVPAVRSSWSFRGVSPVTGTVYYTHVAALDHVGHVGVVTTSPGQLYDDTVPTTQPPSSLPQCGQREPADDPGR